MKTILATCIYLLNLLPIVSSKEVETVKMVQLKIGGASYSVNLPKSAVAPIDATQLNLEKARRLAEDRLSKEFPEIFGDFSLVSGGKLLYKEGELFCFIFEKRPIRSFGETYELPETIYCYCDSRGNVYTPTPTRR